MPLSLRVNLMMYSRDSSNPKTMQTAVVKYKEMQTKQRKTNVRKSLGEGRMRIGGRVIRVYYLPLEFSKK